MLCNLDEDLIEYIAISIPRVGNFMVDVIYRTMPDAYFACKGRGHITHFCPNKTKATPTKKAQDAMADQEQQRQGEEANG